MIRGISLRGQTFGHLRGAKCQEMTGPNIVTILQSLVACEDEEELLELQEDLGYILDELSPAFDPNVPFHVKNITEGRPPKLPELPEVFAAAPAEQDSIAAAVWSGRTGSPEAVQLRQHEWLAYLVNGFGRQEGFKLICQVSFEQLWSDKQLSPGIACRLS